MIDRAGLADFLRRRRDSLQPEDVGLPRGSRRRTDGLRREEVASLCHMSIDYYARLERERGPQPSGQMLAAMAHGLRLSPDERDHLFRLAGHLPPVHDGTDAPISPGLLRVFDRLIDTPAEILTELGETLRQTPPAVALLGDATGYTGLARSRGYRWFTDPGSRDRYATDDRPALSRMYVALLRRATTLRGPDSRPAHVADLLRHESDEFRELWDRHEVVRPPDEVKRFLHPEVGPLTLHCQVVVDPDRAHTLLVYTATPGGEDDEKLRSLSARALGVVPA